MLRDRRQKVGHEIKSLNDFATETCRLILLRSTTGSLGPGISLGLECVGLGLGLGLDALSLESSSSSSSSGGTPSGEHSRLHN